MERPTKVEVGQLWNRVPRYGVRRVDRVIGKSVHLVDPASGGFCGTRDIDEFAQETFVGWATGYGPTHPVTSEPAIGSVWTAAFMGKRVITAFYAAGVDCGIPGHLAHPDVAGKHAHVHTASPDRPGDSLYHGFNQWPAETWTMVSEPAKRETASEAPRCKCGKAMVPARPDWVCTRPNCGAPADWECSSSRGGCDECHGLCATHAQLPSGTPAKPEAGKATPKAAGTTAAAPAEVRAPHDFGDPYAVCVAHSPHGGQMVNRVCRNCGEATDDDEPCVPKAWREEDDADSRLYTDRDYTQPGALLIATEIARSSPFEKLYGRVEPSDRYPELADPDADIPDAWEVRR